MSNVYENSYVQGNTNQGNSSKGFDGKSRTSGDDQMSRKETREWARKAVSEADSKLNTWEKSSNWDKAATQSFLLADSLEVMFSSDRYFGEGVQIESLSTAIEAAEEARDNVFNLRSSQIFHVEAQDMSQHEIKREYKRNKVASAFMILWCARGLTGQTKVEAARQVFYSSLVTSPKIDDWSGFKQVLRKECKHYI